MNYKPFKDIENIVKDKGIKVKYPRGYHKWKKKFQSEYKRLKDVSRTLDSIHGPKPTNP